MSCKNYEDELRRIKEKYGDLLDDTEEKTVILTGEQCLALLPADAPISHSIFEAGFYFNGRGVKYRSSFRSAWMLLPALGCGFAIGDLVIKFVGFMLMITGFLDKNWGTFWFGFFLSLVMFNLGKLFVNTLDPSTEFDVNSRLIRKGRIFVSKIAFADIAQVSATEFTKNAYYKFRNQSAVFVTKKSGRDIAITRILLSEAFLAKYVAEGFSRLIDPDMPIEYIVVDN